MASSGGSSTSSSGSSAPAATSSLSSGQQPGGGGGGEGLGEDPWGRSCLSCRITGTAVCWSVGAYLAAQQYAAPAPPLGAGRLHRAVMLAAAGGFLVLGAARALVA